MKDAKALLSFAVLMASLAPAVEATSAVAPRGGEAALIVADAAVEFSARGVLLSWRAGLHVLLFLLLLRVIDRPFNIICYMLEELCILGC